MASEFSREFFSANRIVKADLHCARQPREQEEINLKNTEKTMDKMIVFDMDGTIADLYGVENWSDFLINEEPTPYIKAKPLCNLRVLARKLNILQQKGVKKRC